MTLPLQAVVEDFDQRWIERRIRGKHLPNWLMHWRIKSVVRAFGHGRFWYVLEPGQLEGVHEPAGREFDTFEEARAHVAEKVTEWMTAQPTYGRAALWSPPGGSFATLVFDDQFGAGPYTLDSIHPTWCNRHSTYHYGGQCSPPIVIEDTPCQCVCAGCITGDHCDRASCAL